MLTKHLYSAGNLIAQFKEHALPILEGSNGAICHAFNSHLNKLDMLQSNFVCELNLSAETAFLQHNMTPLKLRHNIGMLGLLFRIRCGFAHPGFSVCFPPAVAHHTCTRAGRMMHNLQIQDFCDGTHNDWMRRLLFGFVRTSNKLPLHFVEGTVSVSALSASIDRIGACSVPRDNRTWAEIWDIRP